MSMHQLVKELELNGSGRLITILSGDQMGKCATCLANGTIAGDDGIDWEEYKSHITETYPTMVIIRGETVLYELVSTGKKLVIFGGGHISQPLAKIATMLGYLVTVIDDRPEFTTPAIFPDADKLYTMDFKEVFERLQFPTDTAYVIVTRGHGGDKVCLQQVLAHGLYSYVGMIGSRTKNKQIFDDLRAIGVSQEQIDTVHAPIGLPIGGQTPAEIAVSIAGELVQHHHGMERLVLEKEMMQGILDGETGIMATIIKKHGSAPRGVGSRMFCTHSGKVYGTVGGGTAEFRTTKKAKELLNAPKSMIEYFVMNKSDVKALGMICGGDIEVLFQVID